MKTEPFLSDVSVQIAFQALQTYHVYYISIHVNLEFEIIDRVS